MLNELSESDKGYLAGFFDGEGSIGIQKRAKSNSFYARLMMGSTNLSALIQFHNAFGGTIHKVKHDGNIKHKESWMWSACGKNLDSCLNTLLPYLRIKLPQARIALELSVHMKKNLHYVKGRQGIQKLSPDIFNYRMDLKQKINDLNKTGMREVN